MSYINGPRINLWGGGSTNVDTANNTQYDHHGQSLIDLANASVTDHYTDEQVIEKLRQPSDPDDKHASAVGGWNYYGDHQVGFQSVKVSSGGRPGAMNKSTGLEGLPVYLLGGVEPETGQGPYGGPVMVDLDPTSSSTTQIFAGGLLIGDPDNPTLLLRGNRVCYSRLLGFRYDPEQTHPPYQTPGSAFANGTFQLAFPSSDIVQYDKSNDLLKALVEAPGSQGIVLRFSMFQFYPGRSPEFMQKNYQDEQNDANPSLGHIIGSLGPWYEDEPATDPIGRHLENNNLGVKQHMPAQGLAWLDEPGKRLTLDLNSALAGKAIRQDGQDNTAPIGPNVDYGELSIHAGDTLLGKLPSDPEHYYEYGGLYDLTLGDDALAAAREKPLRISSSQNDLSISERPVRIVSDWRNTYVDSDATSAEVHLRIAELGGPVKNPITLQLASSAPGALKNPGFLQFPASVDVPAGATEVRFTVTFGDGDGFSQIDCSAPCAKTYSAAFRKYPEEDFSHLLDQTPIPWKDVYEHCLRFFYVLFPAMSKRIPLNDEKTINAVGAEILKRTSDAYRDTTLYMPLTRALSPAKIKLLRAYLTQKH